MTFAYGHEVSERLIGLAIAVHRILGPGLLESAYETCLCWELEQNGIAHTRQSRLPVTYKGVRLDCGYRLDIVVNNELIVELKSTEKILPIHEAQMMTYLRLSGRKIGLIINFNTATLKNGIKRIVL
jgi:GxxExxY protein